MQKLVALSTTKEEYIALSSALRGVIAIINILEELKGQGFGIHSGTPNVKCKTFEDKKAALRSQQITRLVLEQNIYQCACIISVPILYEKNFHRTCLNH